MALGATSRSIFGMVIGQGMRPILIGIALGLLGAFGLSRFMTALLFGVEAADPLTYAAVAAVVTATALMACRVPALRALLVNPAASTTGELVRQHDIGESTANGSRRKFLTIFARGGEAFANSLVENRRFSISEIHRLKDDQLLMSIPATDLVGPVLGILPDGRAVGRNISLSLQRDSIQIR